MDRMQEVVFWIGLYVCSLDFRLQNASRDGRTIIIKLCSMLKRRGEAQEFPTLLSNGTTEHPDGWLVTLPNASLTTCSIGC